MKLIVVFGLLLVVAVFAPRYIGDVSILGIETSSAWLFAAPLMTIRDMIQQRYSRRYLIITMLVSATIIYFWLNPLYAMAAIAAVVWTEILDFVFYTLFRPMGWFVGVVVSDVMTLPVMPLLLTWFQFGLWLWPGTTLIAELLVLVCVYLALFFIPQANKLFPNIPKVCLARENDDG